VLAIAGLAVAGMLGRLIFDEIRAPARCRANLTQISLALRAYHEVHGSFPPAYVLGATGDRYHSWRVLLLPFLGQDDLYRQYRLDEPWNSEHNQALANKMPAAYASPFASSRRSGVANFLAITGPATAWPEQYAVRLEDIHDDKRLTIQLVESTDSDVLWIEPRDITHEQALRHEYSRGRSFHVAMADGRVVSLSHDLVPEIYAMMLTISGGRWFDRGEWPARADSSNALAPTRPAADFRQTDVLPFPTGPIIKGRNYVYCSTFEIAWNEARQLLGGGPISLVEPVPMVDALNRHTFASRNLSEDSYIVRAGVGSAAFGGETRAQMERRFPGLASDLLNRESSDHELCIYTYLLKSLPFGAEFDSLLTALPFEQGGERIDVASFGVRDLNDSDSRGREMQAQVTVLDYVSDDDFVLQLTPTGPRDEIVLAKVVADETLEKTVAAVRQRIARPDPRHREKRMIAAESLVVPKLSANIDRRYSEIERRQITGGELSIGNARQIIRFRLDETGARLESEVDLSVMNGHDPPPPGQRKFIFDKPFLIYLFERNADQPYFAAWIDNTELMEPFSK
jgi:hypothetical protein